MGPIQEHNKNIHLLLGQTYLTEGKECLSKQDVTSSQLSFAPTSTGILPAKECDRKTSAKKGRTPLPLGSAEECATQELQELNCNEPFSCSPSYLGPWTPKRLGLSVEALHLHPHVPENKGQPDREALLTLG